MDRLTGDDLEMLISLHDEWCISLYMPISRKGAEASGNQTRFKNLLRLAEHKLQERGLREDKAREQLQPAWEFLAEHDWREHPADGLAVFLREGELLDYRLPLGFEEAVKVERRFHLRPLWPLFTVDGRFYVLALSQKHVRLLLGTRQSVAELPLEGIPQSIDEIQAQYTVQEQMRAHSGAPASKRKESAVFHGGHGGAAESKDDDLDEFFRLVAQGVHAVLREEQTAPLVLAGVDSVLAHYRHTNTYGHLAEAAVLGNPETLSSEDLHQRAWEVVEPIFARCHQRALEQWALAASREQTRHHLDEVLPAAVGGQVAALFVPLNTEIWGTYDADTATVELHENPEPGDADLLDLLLVETVANRGGVYALPAPELPARPVAAILRY
jgi:hypothetical protein